MMTTLKLWLSTITSTFTTIGALVVFAAIYAALVVSSWFFISTREATVAQVLATYSLMILIPALFFLYQAAIISRVRDGKFRWRTIALNTFRFFLGTIPLLLVAWLLYYLLNKLAVRYPPPIPLLPPVPGAAPSAPLHWPTLLFGSLKFVLLGVALPLAAIHLWIEMASCDFRESLRNGPRFILNRLGRRFASAFGADSVLIYALGLILFVVIPYAVLFVPFSPKGNKSDFVVFVLRLALSFIFTFIGWVITVSALTRKATDPIAEPSPDRSPAIAVEAAA